MATDEALRQAVESCDSMRGVMAALGYSQSGQTAKMLKRRITELGMEVPSSSKTHSRNLRPLGEVLIENSTYNTNSLKKRLVAEGCLENRCARPDCPVEGVWLGRSITLQLEHKNGVHSDNRIENLELLCPNCHTQTETWGRKSRNAPMV